MAFVFDGRDLLAGLEQVSARLGRTIQRRVLEEAAEPLRQRMAELAPYEPGAPDLRDEMLIRPAQGVDAREVVVAVGPSTRGFYGSFQEFGTSRHGAQPFARPAFDATATDIVGRIGRGLWRELAARGIVRTRVSSGPVVGGARGSSLL